MFLQLCDSSVLLSKGEIEKEVKNACDVLALVVVEENAKVNVVPPIMRHVLEEYHDVIEIIFLMFYLSLK